MRFERLSHVKLNKKTGQPISKKSVEIYRGLLNRLAEAEIDTKQKLIEEYEAVISIIDFLHPTDSKEDNAQKRHYYCAIFYALDEYPLDKQLPYYEAFQRAKDKA